MGDEGLGCSRSRGMQRVICSVREYNTKLHLAAVEYGLYCIIAQQWHHSRAVVLATGFLALIYFGAFVDVSSRCSQSISGPCCPSATVSVDLKGLTALCLPGKEGCPKQGKNQASSFAIPAALVHVGDAFLKGNTSNCGVEVSAHSPIWRGLLIMFCLRAVYEFTN